MRKILSGGALLIIISFLLALVHSCSKDNGMLKPFCNISEVDLDEKWWYPENNTVEAAIYFRSNGLINIKGRTDSISFLMENCNKIHVTNLSTGYQEQWVIKNLSDKTLSIQFPVKGLVTYSLTK